MTEKMQKLLFVQNARPDLQETLDFIENQVTVESMTKAPTKVADTVNNVLDEPKKTDNIRCWDCHGRHKRSECTADKKSLYCKRCRVNGHSYEACRRGRRATRSPSQSGYTTRSSAPSPASTSSEETEQKEEKKKNKKKQRRSRRDNKSKEDTRQKRASSASASRSRSSSKTRGKAGRTPKTKRKTRDTVNMIDESSDFSESQSSMKATRMAHLKQGQSPSSQLKVTLDTGSRYNILDESEALSRGWKVDKLSEWQEPCLKYADGRRMPISGKATLWISLSENQNKRKVELFVTPNLNSKMIIGLIDLKRLGWTTPAWPLDIERYQTLFQTPSTDDESEDEDIVNNIDDENTPAGASSENSEKEKNMEKIDSEKEKDTEKSDSEKEKDMEKIDQEDDDDDDEERPEGEICITDFEDLKTYRDIPDFKN